MFRFVYSIAAEAERLPDGFAGVEADAAPAEGLWIGSRRDVAEGEAGPAYVVRPAVSGQSVAVIGKQLHDDAERRPGMLILIENGGAFAAATGLWSLMEATRHPRVKLALDIDAARAAGQTPAVLVPTLNLRIGLVRVRKIDADAIEYGRRLAGIGFDGYVVIDPPAGGDRAAEAEAIAGAFRGIYPVKPVKKAMPSKVAK